MKLIHAHKLQQIWNLLEFELLNRGCAELDSSWSYVYACPAFSRLYYTLDGSGWVELQGQRAELHAGTVCLIPARSPVRCGCPERMTQLYFHISARTCDGYDLFSRCSRILELPAPDAAGLGALFTSGRMLDGALLKNRIEADLWRLIAEGGLEDSLLASRSAFLERVFAAVRQNLNARLKISDVADMLSLPESTLVKRFHREFGITLGRYIDEMLYQEIVRLLHVSDLSIGQIADRLGFCDQFYLSRFFKKYQSESPARYRARTRSLMPDGAR